MTQISTSMAVGSWGPGWGPAILIERLSGEAGGVCTKSCSGVVAKLQYGQGPSYFNVVLKCGKEGDAADY